MACDRRKLAAGPNCRRVANPKQHLMIDAESDDPTVDVEKPLKTIAVSDRDVAAATRLLNAIAGVEYSLHGELTALANAHLDANLNQDRSLLAERARRAYVSRAERSKIFSPTMFGEAAWDMLLALYVTDQSGSRHTVGGLLKLAGAPPTTALRWVDFLEKEQLVSRIPHPLDRRILRVELTPKARTLLDDYFSANEPE
jgi:DNA-binding MarR family transcriptional regulator